MLLSLTKNCQCCCHTMYGVRTLQLHATQEYVLADCYGNCHAASVAASGAVDGLNSELAMQLQSKYEE